MGGRAVLRGLGRDAVLLVRIGQRAAQIGLAPARLRRLGLRQGSLLHRDVRLDAERLDGAAGWCEIARGGQAHGAAEPEWNDGLHRALPEGLGTHPDGPAVVLQRARTALRDRNTVGWGTRGLQS